MVQLSFSAIQHKLSAWLVQGISPRRLAVTLAMGFVLGCFPLLGVTTVLCILLALALRLNLPAMQAANYAAMPVQVVMIWPFFRLGQHLLPSGARHFNGTPSLHGSPSELLAQLGGAAGAALLAWLLFAIPTAALLTLLLTPILRRFPVLAAAEHVPERTA